MRDRTAIAEITPGNLPADIAYNYKGRAASLFFVLIRIIFGGTLQIIPQFCTACRGDRRFRSSFVR